MRGDQRHSLEKLHSWEEAAFGMFIHFGMSTFVGEEMPSGDHPPETYGPDSLDVDGWVRLDGPAGDQAFVLPAWQRT